MHNTLIKTLSGKKKHMFHATHFLQLQRSKTYCILNHDASHFALRIEDWMFINRGALNLHCGKIFETHNAENWARPLSTNLPPRPVPSFPQIPGSRKIHGTFPLLEPGL